MGPALSTARVDWLSRALARAGALPLAEAERAIRAGRVSISGRTVHQPLAPVRPGDAIRVDGVLVEWQVPTRAVAFHKPAGLVTAPGPGGVFEPMERALPAALRAFHWHAVGRLDKNTTGLLLFTNDERLVAHVTSPSTHLAKRYIAHVQGRARDEQLDPIRRGILLNDGPARPAEARLLGDGSIELTLSEGRNHQVKRMLAAVGFPVTRLHRQSIGAVELDVALGEVRLLSADEISLGLRFTPSP